MNYNDTTTQEKYINYNIPDEDSEINELIQNSLICSHFPPLEYKNTKCMEIVRQIEKFSLLKNNWDGFNGMPLSNAVAEKSKIIVEHIDFKLYEYDEIDVKITPYSTLIIDWYNNKNEFSLEIGKDYLGYYCDGDISKEVPQLEISNEEQIIKAVNQVKKDLEKIL